MDDRIISSLVAVIALLSGLIATYVSLQNRALLAEVRCELAEMENRVIFRLNGTYVRASECRLREDLVHERINCMVEAVKKRDAADN